jgi:ABC-2 type transport system permease protein
MWQRLLHGIIGQPAELPFDAAGSARRILAVLRARNREFYRDTAGLIWNIAMPVMMIAAFAFIFSDEPKDLLKVGLLGADARLEAPPAQGPAFLGLRHIDVIPIDDRDAGIVKVERHQLDLLLEPGSPTVYWVNDESANGYLAERLLLGSEALAADVDGVALPQRQAVSGQALSYADWVLPGVLAMNVMFGSLWGVGWVVVRYRKNGVLRRLKATPLTPFEFLTAQVISRLAVVLGSSTLVLAGAMLLLDAPMRGSYATLFLTYTLGALCMISLGLIVSSRLRTEELADGLLNLMSWPMLLLSSVWFSMEGTSAAAQALSVLMPLTHLVSAARAIMIDGAGLMDVLPQLGLLLALAVLLLTLASRLFRWE